MLQQILRDMWIHPDLLAELGEDQKQTLFCKMREEQVRRWKIRDEEEQKQQELQKRKKMPRVSKVTFRLGVDGQPWVWVMGEHPNDLSIEQILELEGRTKARQLAEKETLELRKSVEAEITEILDMNQKQIEKLEAATKNFKAQPVASKSSRLEIFSSENMGKPSLLIECDDKKRNRNHTYNNKVATVVAQWERKVLEERTSQIFNNLKRKQMALVKEAEDMERRQELLWKEQEKKAKEAEIQIRQIARRAREEHRRTSFCDENTLPAIERTPCGSELVSLNPVGIPRPPNRLAIAEWFRSSELERKAGLDEVTNKPASWFHGLISRQDAEAMLCDKPIGSFLLRLSERIWGYAITYRDTERCKHYLIDASNGHYQFLGIEQIQHNSLGDLVRHHQVFPITGTGGELLVTPCQPFRLPEVFRDTFAAAADNYPIADNKKT